VADQIDFGGDDVDGIDLTNVQPRCPCLLLLDVSTSMNGEPIQELNAGLKAFKDDLQGDELAMQRVEVGILTFGPVQIEMPFHSAETFVPPTLTTQGNTPMGEAITHAIDMVQRRKADYATNGIPYNRPWIFLITDGAPTDPEKIPAAIDAIRKGEDGKAFTFFVIGVKGADMGVLKTLSTHRTPMSLDGLKFKEFFVWLSASLQQASRSATGTNVQLPNPGSWGHAPT
jgi:uncharacterized protein YegL